MGLNLVQTNFTGLLFLNLLSILYYELNYLRNELELQKWV